MMLLENKLMTGTLRLANLLDTKTLFERTSCLRTSTKHRAFALMINGRR